tara:strand:- start:9735 stop:10076 length:342 start_codon:yes stop_codon:yes gene_type:complete
MGYSGFNLNERKEKMNENLAKFVLGSVALVVAVLANGYVVMTMWGWFISPTFSMELLTFSESIGLSMFVTYCANSPSFIKEEFKDEFGKQLAGAVFRPLVTLAFACLYLNIFF